MESRRGSPWWVWLILLLIAALIAVIWLLFECRRKIDAANEAWNAGLPGCQQDSVLIVRGPLINGVPPDTITNIPLAEETDNIPEFHDCQRLVDRSGYGAMVAIWAADDLETFASKWVTPGSGEPAPAHAAAQLYNFGYSGTETYAPLDIKPGFSCLYMRPGAPGVGWEAWMVHVGDADSACLEPFYPASGSGVTKLQVKVTPPPRDLAPSDIPPVTRWAFDMHGERQYIGIKCGEAWCDIGANGFDANDGGKPSVGLPALSFAPMSSAALTAAEEAAAKLRVRRVREVPGWADEQELAMKDPIVDTLVPSGLRGRVVPHPDLEDLPFDPDQGFPPGRWIQTATILIDGAGRPGAQAYYEKKLGVTAGSNQVWTCKIGDAADPKCELDGASSPPPPSCVTPGAWISKVVRPGGMIRYGCIKKMDHGGSVIPAGAARWRWMPDDETTWFRCEEGCCTVL